MRFENLERPPEILRVRQRPRLHEIPLLDEVIGKPRLSRSADRLQRLGGLLVQQIDDR